MLEAPASLLDVLHGRDPVAFADRALGVKLWSKQVDVLRATFGHKRVAVPSGHAGGKSFVAAVAALAFVVMHPGARVVTTARNWQQVDDVLWREIRRLHANSVVDLGGHMMDTPKYLIDREGWGAVGISPDHPDAMQGRHAPHVLVIFDEAQAIDDVGMWMSAESLLAGGDAHMLAIGNPLVTSGPFYDACHDPSRWHVVHIDCEQHPNIAAERGGLAPPFPDAVRLSFIEEMARHGTDSAVYRSRVRGLFPLDSEDTLLTRADFERLDARFRPPGPRPSAFPMPDDDKHIGQDVAYYGSDANVALLLDRGRVATTVEWRGVDTQETAGRVRELAGKWGVAPGDVHIDLGAMGPGVVDPLVGAGWAVDPVQFGESPKGDWAATTGTLAFKNRRSELYWVARMLVRECRLDVPPDQPQIRQQLCQTRFLYTPKGEIAIEPKDRIRERIGRSPDHADALVLALSRGYRGPLLRIMDRRQIR